MPLTQRPLRLVLPEYPAEDPGPTALHALGLRADHAEPASPRERLLASEAYSKGFEAGSAFARSEAAREIEAERARSAQHLTEARKSWARDEAERLAHAFDMAIAQAETRICDALARVLRPVLEEEARNGVVRVFAQNVRTLLGDPNAMRMSISGPADLLADLRLQLGELSDRITFIENQAPEVTLVAGETRLETQLDAWLRLIRSAPE